VTPRAPRARRGGGDPDPGGRLDGLTALGLRTGAVVRFRRRPTERWKEGVVSRREADGSLGVRDAKGSLRALPLELVEVRTVGPRGGVAWEPLPERAARTEQLDLF
jgi:hypothetical protein